MELNRKPTKQEKKLLEILIKKSNIMISENWKTELRVCSIGDGGMGSLLLFPKEQIMENRIFGRQVSDFIYKDLDGVDVIVSLNVDENENLFELDIWKTNYERVLKLPDL